MAKVWMPVEDGEITTFLVVDDNGKILGVYAGDDYTDWYATEELPDNIRLCRQVEAAPLTQQQREALKIVVGEAEASLNMRAELGDYVTPEAEAEALDVVRAMLGDQETQDES